MAQSAAIFFPHSRTNKCTHTLSSTGVVEVITCPPVLCTNTNTHTFITYLKPLIPKLRCAGINAHSLHKHTHALSQTKTHKLDPHLVSLSSTPDFVPVTLGDRCQWLLLRFLRRGLEGGWRKAWPGITQLSSLHPSVSAPDE